MPAQPQIKPTGDKSWINRHETFTQKIDNFYDVINGDTGNVLKDYNATTKALQEFFKKAIAEGKKVRAIGGGWSFSEVATTDGWLLNTKQMNMLFEVNENSISNDYTDDKNNLLFVQCGNSVQELNRFLEPRNKSLKTSGASNGQTLAGAISTGTHGSALDFGATQDFVVGLHIIISPDRHIWLERKSNPIVSDSFVAKLNTEIVRDDALFDSALVSFGSFGFIHGLMIETEEKYLLECYRQKVPYSPLLKNIMETLDFTNAPLPYGSERPFHFQVVINQYNLNEGAFVTTMYKRKFHDNYKKPEIEGNKAGPGDDAPVFIGLLTDFLPSTVPAIVNKLMKSVYTTDAWWGTTGEIFFNTITRGKVLSAAMGIPINYVNKVTELLLKVNETIPFPGIYAYRFVKKSKALMAFTQFDQTCVMELDAVNSDLTWEFYEAVWEEFDKNNIPYTFHWGKIFKTEGEWVKKGFQANRDAWLKARNNLLTAESRNLFTNNALIKLGLA